MSIVFMMIFLFLFFALSIASTILLAVWIYKDAKKRNMDAAVWTLLVVFVPSYIGVIAYFISREKHKIYACPRCGGVLNEDYAVCPTCTLPLKRQCPQCGLNCEETWHNCPRCSHELEPMMYPFAKPQVKKDHLIRNVVLLILATIVAFIGMYVSMFAFMITSDEFTVESDMPFIQEYDDYEIYPGNIEFDIK